MPATIRSPKRTLPSPKRTLLLLAALLALVALRAPNALAAGALAKAERVEPLSGAAVHFHRESVSQLRSQLAQHAVREATFNVLAHHLHLLMDSRRLMLVNYQPKEKRTLESELKAAGVTITAEPPSSTSSHHRIRYIIGALLTVAILAVLTVLLLGRRRKLAAERAAP